MEQGVEWWSWPFATHAPGLPAQSDPVRSQNPHGAPSSPLREVCPVPALRDAARVRLGAAVSLRVPGRRPFSLLAQNVRPTTRLQTDGNGIYSPSSESHSPLFQQARSTPIESYTHICPLDGTEFLKWRETTEPEMRARLVTPLHIRCVLPPDPGQGADPHSSHSPRTDW